jgi:hypothetical protein
MSEVTAYIDGRNMPRAHGTPEMRVWGNLFRYIAEVSDALTFNQEAIVFAFQTELIAPNWLATSAGNEIGVSETFGVIEYGDDGGRHAEYTHFLRIWHWPWQ